MGNLIFGTYLEKHAHDIDAFLQTAFEDVSNPDIRRYLYEPLAAFTANGGKRHRPLICILACCAVGGTEHAAYSAAAAIEHFQSGALIHDDIADDSLVRRGRPCLHRQIGEGLAINAGDLALSLVTGTVLNDKDLPDVMKLRVIKELIDMTARTIEGQALDVGWARDERFDITIDDYLTMARHKTAYYSGAVPLAIGAIIGGGSEKQIEVLRAYGLSTGLAFQIQDDLLNLVGKEEVVNKDFRRDLTEGKRTLVVIHALAHTQGGTRDELLDIISSHEVDPVRLQRAVDIMIDAGSIDYARLCATELAHKHQNDLKSVLPCGMPRKLLLSMSDFFISRLN